MNRRRHDARSNPQRGAALIVALLVVATVVVLATTLSGDFLLMFRRVENQLHGEQAYGYLLGAEGVARAALLQDKRTSPDTDNLFEEWAKPQKFPTDYGWIAGQLEDLQGRFNLNSIVAKATLGQTAARDESQRILLRLLLALPLEEPLAADQAEALVDAITDWIDVDDDVTGLGGAESQFYAAAEPPGRPANRALASPSELMWVRGMTPEIYRALEGVVTIWPKKTAGTINLNTAPALVLAAVNGPKTLVPLEASVLDQLLAERKAKRTLDIEAINALLTDQIDATGKAKYGGKSDYFQLTAQTEFLGRRYTLRSVLHRGEKDVRVVARTFGEW